MPCNRPFPPLCLRVSLPQPPHLHGYQLRQKLYTYHKVCIRGKHEVIQLLLSQAVLKVNLLC